MTVQELIEELQKVEDKTQEVVKSLPTGDKYVMQPVTDVKTFGAGDDGLIVLDS